MLLGNNKMDECHPLTKNSIKILTYNMYRRLIDLGYTRKHICQAAGISKYEIQKIEE